MEYLKQETKAGVLITVSFGILCFFLFNVTGMKDRAEMNHYAVTFSNINGLMENAPVTFAGVNVGKVEWIKIKSQTEGAVDVGISVRTSIKLNEDSRVMISSAGFVGEK
ncbi:MAG TPA: MlaD family protein, partial [bacterium]|nr:MlaD family protein [bacterium]